ncbi:MAG: hypothetical protein ACREAY_07245 [Nitrososphaera sp.]|uniref:hypothetical protein n=1 Tax=Nitrososphaera sp. TaxID=1971748 RepID=UPI003D6E4CF1
MQAETNDVSSDHQTAIDGWKARKDQLHRQQASAQESIDESYKVNLLSLSKKNEKSD